ncbi:DNA-directed RNA polymerase II subunit RPB9 [Wallemia ichthyophaga EXF-994]|uniref:DNA-directed RNA polymerase II subunit RPB9 n=1 Tax=Wallemia ichthyophaga (strain EXF-994 / CBS 113033) TaxID=1299270 RepID=R9AQ49_WALI9|nr:DNA-directed RNA polymerase II subunit RPB9 [Wallemia ichthyophaga EXF-994]EOR04185.1 DNA-directed RNA polymerase II subunit RPB9 [Wallemia ichthyophaga EXF-994]
MTSPSLHAVMESQKKHADEFWKLFHKAKIHSDAPSEDGEDDVVSVYTGSGISTPNRRRDRSEERIGPERDPMKIFTHDISTNIFRRLSQQDLKQCHRVCKRWRRSQVINYIWFEIYRQRFFDGESTQSLQGKWTRRESRQDWKLMYKSANRRPFESAVVEQLERSITPSQIREAQWDAEANKPPPTKNEQREEYKLLKGRKPRSKGVRGENTSKGEDRERRVLLFACRNCNFEEAAVEARVYRNDLMTQSKEEAGVTQDLGKDPTLPRTSIECPKCTTNQVVFFQDQSKRTETRMTLFFRSFSVDQLADFNGRNGKDIYLAVNGLVFDVSSNPRIYGPGGMYHAAVAKDAARAFVTNCFKDQPTHDLRGLTEKELSQVKGWQSFFDNHPKYMLVGGIFSLITLSDDSTDWHGRYPGHRPRCAYP